VIPPEAREELATTLAGLLSKMMDKVPTAAELLDPKIIVKYSEAVALLLLSVYQKDMLDHIEVWKLFPRYDPPGQERLRQSPQPYSLE